MRDLGLQRVIRGKPIRTTISDKAAACPLDHVNRQFHAPAPNRLWVSDFTYVSTWAGARLWAVPQALPPPALYVAFVIDVYARYIVGLTQDLFASGEDAGPIAQALRWSSVGTALRYGRRLAPASNAAARMLAGRRC